MEDNEFRNIVIDVGSGVCKAGFAGDDLPIAKIPTIVGYLQNAAIKNIKESFIGIAAQREREKLNLKYPMHSGIITNWEEMEKIWNFAFSEMQVKPENHNVLLNESPMNPKANKEKMIQVMFETFRTPGAQIALSGVLSMYAAGRTTGIVAECGETAAFAYPVCEGYVNACAIERTDIAGRSMNDYLAQLVRARGYVLPTGSERDICREIKEKRAFVSLDFEAELEKHKVQKPIEKPYSLPDGQTLSLGTDTFVCTEPVFRPSLLGLANKGFHELVNDSIMKCSIDMRQEMYSTIVVVGGSALIPGFEKRIQKEIRAKAPSHARVRSVSSGDAKNMTTWVGGSILASVNRFQSLWIHKSEYEEYGPFIVHCKA